MKNTLLVLVLFLCGCSSDNKKAVFKQWEAHSTIDVIFSGDFMQHLPQVNAARQNDGQFNYDSTLKNIVPYWKSADFAIINLETSLTTGEPYTGYPIFRSPREIAFALRRAGITHCALANNHAMDAGLKGVRTTIETLDSAGVGYTGVGLAQSNNESSQRVLYLTKKPFKIALLNYTYGTNGMPIPNGVKINLIDTALIKTHILQAVADSATHIVAFMHWGEEYQREANATQRALGRWLRAAGVDVVVGSHSHVVQQIDPENQIIYSLGNFVSNQRWRYSNTGINIRLTFVEGHRRAKISYLPHYVDDNYNIILTNYKANQDSRDAVELWKNKKL